MGGGALGTAIQGNAIFSNGGLGIDLDGNGIPELNDTGDGDPGANNLQNQPALTAAMTNGAGSANFAGSLNSAASTTYRVEFFASSAVDSPCCGEGQRYLGFTNVATNGSRVRHHRRDPGNGIDRGRVRHRDRDRPLQQHLGVQRRRPGRQDTWS